MVNNKSINSDSEINSIGIDAFELRYATIKSINFDLFERKGGIYKETNDEDCIEIIDSKSGEIKKLKELKIQIKSCSYNKNCMYLEYVMNKLKGEKVISIKANAPKFIYETNEKNGDGYLLSRLSGYVSGHLYRYGIEVDLRTAKVHNFEINYNVHKDKFYQALKLINELWIKRDNKVFKVEEKDGIEFLLLKRPTRQIKIYNKTVELLSKGLPYEFNYNTRIEIKISHISTIEYILGKERSFYKFCNSYKQIVDFYRKTIDKEIKKIYVSYTDEKIDEIVQKLNEGSKLRDICIEKWMNEEILDIDMFERAIKKYYKKTNKKNPYKSIKKLNSYFKDINENKFNEASGNMIAIEQAFKSIGV